jgi:retron-type reverse transcriptase
MTSVKKISKHLSNCIKLNKYEPKPFQQVYILKNNNKKPLNIMSLTDKILQKAIYFILKPLFYHEFKLKSDQFTEKNYCHTILAEIYNY